MFEIINGWIDSGLTIDHLCKTRVCVNPRHMELVSSGENAMRGDGPCAKNAKKVECSRGHALAGWNLMIRRRASGKVFRNCRICHNECTKRNTHV